MTVREGVALVWSGALTFSLALGRRNRHGGKLIADFIEQDELTGRYRYLSAHQHVA